MNDNGSVGSERLDQERIAIVMLTYNRLGLLKLCVENVLRRVSDRCSEIVIWNNGSDPAVIDYLGSLNLPGLRVENSAENLGHNAYDLAVALTTAPLIVEVDDDVIDAPQHWDARLAEAYTALPKIGFLAANLVDDPNDETARIMYGPSANLYRIEWVAGHELKRGPVGGGCAMTDRRLYKEVGGFGRSRSVFWLEDAAYIKKIERLGYECAYLASLRVHHAGGEFYSPNVPAKQEWWRSYYRKKERRDVVKRAILKVPGTRQINRRFKLFVAPEDDPLRFTNQPGALKQSE